MVIESYTQMNRFCDESIEFFNHGYSPSYPEYDNMLMKNRLSLYHYLVKDVGPNKKVLDVGCGRGGFTKVYSRFGFSEIHGCDLTPANIYFAQSHYKGKFEVCDAHLLSDTYKEEYFDVITNLESAHHYHDRNLFFSEAKKILKKDGVFIYADVEAKIDRHFDVIIEDDITENVKNSSAEILEECNRIDNEEIKKIYLPLARHAYDMYHLKGKRYIKYTCYDKERS